MTVEELLKAVLAPDVKLTDEVTLEVIGDHTSYRLVNVKHARFGQEVMLVGQEDWRNRCLRQTGQRDA